MTEQNWDATILIGLGANLPSDRYGPPQKTLPTALRLLTERGVHVVRQSSWYESEAVPPSGQPNYINGVVAVDTQLDPHSLLTVLHGVERALGRVRTTRNEARVADLDLLAYGDRVLEPDKSDVAVPHPRLQNRAFVLLPLRDVVPGWRHPVSGLSVDVLIDRLPRPWRAWPLSSGLAFEGARPYVPSS